MEQVDDGKENDSWESGFKSWKAQPDMAACLPVCIFNVLMDMSQRADNVFEDTYSYGRIAMATRYDRRLGTSWDIAFDGVRRMFREDKVQHWAVRDIEGRKSRSARICEVIDAPNCPYPIVSLGPEYLRDYYGIELEGNPFEWPSHCVVALRCTETECVIHDPYAPFDGQNPLKRMDRNKLESYWGSALPIKAMAWFEKVSTPLEQFSEGKL